MGASANGMIENPTPKHLLHCYEMGKLHAKEDLSANPWGWWNSDMLDAYTMGYDEMSEKQRNQHDPDDHLLGNPAHLR